MEFVNLNRESKDIKIFEKINFEAFPPNERLEFDRIFDFADRENVDFLGIYDNALPVGFILFLKNSECGYVYFFAIDKNSRSKGYGGAALKKLAETYPELQIILDFEEIDPNAENAEQRLKRKSFYLRNGFCETGNYTFLNEQRFEVVCTKGELNRVAFKKLIKILHANFSEFLDALA